LLAPSTMMRHLILSGIRFAKQLVSLGAKVSKE
jgi:hypothetical protein